MDFSKISFAFQQNNIFAAKSPFGKTFAQQSPINDVLNRISNNIVGAQERRTEMESAIRTQEVKMDAYTSEIDAAQQKSLEEMPDELLHFLRNTYMVQRNMSCKMEQELTSFRDELMGIDQTIQEYQDIIDGKSLLPEDLTMEDVTKLLEFTKAAREQFVQDNAERLNEWNVGNSVIGNSYTARTLERVTGENKFAGADASTWEIDATASDIYAEIDRVLSATRSVTETMEEGYRRICNELEKRGYTEWRYEDHLESMRQSKEPVGIETMDIRQFVLEYMKKASELTADEG